MLKSKLMMICAALGLTMGISVANIETVSKEALQKRAAFALRVDARQVKIDDIKYDGGRVEFIAIVKNKKTPCYVTASYDVVSDAMCSGVSNALLDAANGRR